VRSSGAVDRRSHELQTNPSLLLFSADDLAAGSRYRVKAAAVTAAGRLVLPLIRQPRDRSLRRSIA